MTALPTPGAGDVWGAQLNAAIEELHAVVVASGGATLTSGSTTMLALTSESSDAYGFHDLSTNTSRFTVPTGFGGTYLIVPTVTQTTSNTTGGRSLQIKKNGTNIADIGWSITTSISHQIVTVAVLADGDYVEASLYQNSGSSLDFTWSLAMSRQDG